MNILVVQLARFGDIFQTWPTLNALKRRWPGAKIHLLVRERFKDATFAAESCGFQVHTLKTAQILSPIVTGSPFENSIELMTEFFEELKAIKFEKIVNLSFSPFSSFLVDFFREDGCEVSGYCRHSDGYLAIPDDSSAYFYAQVGVGGPNRFHVTEIFAAVAGVELIENDFYLPNMNVAKSSSIVVHLGASQRLKAYPPEMWQQVVEGLTSLGRPLIFIGSESERAMSEVVLRPFENSEMISNRVGQSRLSDVFQWIAEADLLIGADSAPVQMASLAATRVLNLSCSAVNFWETGPLSKQSRILYKRELSELSGVEIVNEVRAMLQGAAGTALAERDSERLSFKLNIEDEREFDWKLIQALYTASDFPTLPAGQNALGFLRLSEVAQLALEQINSWSNLTPTQDQIKMFDLVDGMLEKIGALEPKVSPILGWFQTERLRIGPNSTEAILNRTTELFSQLKMIADVFVSKPSTEKLVSECLTRISECTTVLREFQVSQIDLAFQPLLTAIQQLSQYTPRLGTSSWSQVLTDLTNSMRTKDYVQVADILEYQLAPNLTVLAEKNIEPVIS